MNISRTFQQGTYSGEVVFYVATVGLDVTVISIDQRTNRSDAGFIAEPLAPSSASISFDSMEKGKEKEKALSAVFSA